MTVNKAATLAKLAEQAGFSLSDVAFVSGLDESTVSRLWNDAGWLDRISGASLQKVIATVPRVAEYVTNHSLATRRNRLVSELADEGLVVSETGLAECARADVPEPYIGNALEAALRIMRADEAGVIAYLARFWGRDQDQALQWLYPRQNAVGLLTDVGPLLAASVHLTPKLTRKAYSFHSILAQATLIHHLGRATGRTEWTLDPAPDDRRQAFTLRSGVMGLLMDGDDVDLAHKYERMVGENPVLQMIEEWSFPTYMRDAHPNSDFALPGSVLLRNTARELVRETDEYSDAYLHYLLATYLPLALQQDSTLGLRAGQITAALRRRMDKTDEPHTRALCERVIRDLQEVSVG